MDEKDKQITQSINQWLNDFITKYNDTIVLWAFVCDYELISRVYGLVYIMSDKVVLYLSVEWYPMLILRRQYHNLLGEPICLDIHRFTNCCQLMITKTNRRWDSLQLLAMAALFVAVFFTANINKILDRLVILSMTIVLMIALVYWRTHAYKESIVLLDNVSGLELTQHYSLLGVHWKRSQFILSSTIIINEAITMVSVCIIE
ncbi:unnamed protein product [Medioppia subpectinata]|uniref:Uncharacterized protein n=1 Tax=Medioppia subpectinata TaxID=1979941 RepID=A0A7R9KHC5_9ACAR|nr:unnamed protein product [Medioppia subpectinata]CAG2103352.1 unnamed protein product [Medioppia subpectinata]